MSIMRLNTHLFALFFIQCWQPFSVVDAGCYQERLCCSGRNLSCASVNTGTVGMPAPEPREPAPNVLPTNTWTINTDRHVKFQTTQVRQMPEKVASSPRLAQLKLPHGDTSELLRKRRPTDAPALESSDAPSGPPTTPTEQKNQSKYKVYFGRSNKSESSGEQVQYQAGDPVIRYVILNEQIPITVERLGYLRVRGQDRCYCDEVCRSLSDCCDDYHYVCPATDCQLSQWGRWGQCEAIAGSERPCGTGVRLRERQIVRAAEHGGKPCEHLSEQTACNIPCQHQELNEVALLLSYEHGGARTTSFRNNIYFDLPNKLSARLSQMESYCVLFDVTWLSGGCLDRDINAELRPGSRVCIECQPTAQLAKGDRCTGQGVDGERSFWSFVGVKQCFGAWRRIEKREKCGCTREHAFLSAYIFV